MKPLTRLPPSGLAWQLKDGELDFSPGNLLLANGVVPRAGGEMICRRSTGTC